MRKHSVPSDVYVITVDPTQSIKGDILGAISNMGKYGMEAGDQKINNTDWHLSSDYPRPYWDIVLNALMPSLMDLAADQQGSLVIDNYWFQQYETGDYHGWHRHKNSMFNCVYFVELPTPNAATRFKFNDQEFTIPVSEGDLIIFPSYLLHKSAKNDGNGRKTVVAVNISLDS